MSGTNTPPESISSKWGPVVISVVTQMTFLVVLFMAWWTEKGLELVIGAAIANATQAVQYWLGSSSGSREKDKTIAANTASP